MLPDSVPNPHGVLTVTLNEFEDLSTGEKTGELPRGQDHSPWKVYALVDYDKSQVLAYAFSVAEYRLHVMCSTELYFYIYLRNPATKSGS